MTVTAIGAALAAVGTAVSVTQQKKAQRQQERAAQQGRMSQAQQAAAQDQAAAQERRQQIREERVKRSQILNASALTGGSGSSGESGALGGMASNLGANLGSNEAMRNSGALIGAYQQNAANFQGAAQTSMARAGTANQIAGLGSQLFAAGGGVDKFKAGAKKLFN